MFDASQQSKAEAKGTKMISNARTSTQSSTDETVDAKWVDAINDLVALTKTRDIIWAAIDHRAFPAPGKDALGREIAIQAVYEADYKDKRIQLQETGVHLPQAGTPLQAGGFSGGWKRSVVQEAALQTADARLRLLDANRNIVFVFPQAPNMIELLSAVKYQVADVESFLKMLRLDVSAVAGI